MRTMKEPLTSKFWFIQRLEELLRHAGMSQALSDLLTFLTACVFLAVIVWLLNLLATRVALKYIKHAATRTRTKWDDYLYQHHFFHRTVRLVPAIGVLLLINVIFTGYDTRFIEAARVITKCVIIAMAIGVVISFLDASNDIYESSTREKSIKGFVQTAKILVYIIGIVGMISILLNEDPSKLFVGLGASAAVFTLVFRDTILGFVASIQLTAQDMIRRGDWIVVPAHDANGTVLEVTLTTVKVLNWNNTTTMVPIYSMVSGSFTNWRSMEEGTGRQFVRQLYIDSNSMNILTDEQVGEIAADRLVAPKADVMMKLFQQINTSNFATNLGLYRSYVEAYVTTHPNVNPDMLLIIRYLPHTDNGIILQIYAFTKTTAWVLYEKEVADIMEHVMALAPVFGLRLFQVPSGTDIRTLENRNLSPAEGPVAPAAPSSPAVPHSAPSSGMSGQTSGTPGSAAKETIGPDVPASGS